MPSSRNDDISRLEALARKAILDPANTSSVSDLYHTAHKLTYPLAKAIVHDHHRAMEAAHDGFVEAWLKKSQWNPTLPFAPWLATIVRNKARDALREMTRRIGLAEAAAIDETLRQRTSPLERMINKQQLITILEQLGDPRYAEALVLREIWGFSNTEIGDQMHVTRQTITRWFHHIEERFLRLRTQAEEESVQLFTWEET